jgi:hypothetical protein
MTDTQKYSFHLGYPMKAGDNVEVPKTGETGKVVDCEEVQSGFPSKDDGYRITVELPADLDIAQTPNVTNVKPMSIGCEIKDEIANTLEDIND